MGVVNRARSIRSAVRVRSANNRDVSPHVASKIFVKAERSANRGDVWVVKMMPHVDRVGSAKIRPVSMVVAMISRAKIARSVSKIAVQRLFAHQLNLVPTGRSANRGDVHRVQMIAIVNLERSAKTDLVSLGVAIMPIAAMVYAIHKPKIVWSV